MPSDRTIRLRADDEPSRTLAKADPGLGALIDRIEAVERGSITSGFAVVARSVVAQQLSEKVAPVIWGRVLALLGAVTPESVLAASTEDLRAAGLSGRKVEYLQGIAQATLDGRIEWDALENLDDEEVIQRLTGLRGVGRWTAEMYLIFALRRPDVLALDDVGVRISAGRMTGLDRPMTREELAERGERWRPYRSTASLWLWADRGGYDAPGSSSCWPRLSPS